MRFSHPAQVPRSSVQLFRVLATAVGHCPLQAQMQLSRTLHCRPRRLQTLVAFFSRSFSRHQTCTDAIPSQPHCNANTPKSFIRGLGLEASPDTCLCRAVSYRATTRSPPDRSVRPRIAAAQPCPLASRPDLQILAWMPLPLHCFTLHSFVQVLAGAH